MHDDLGDAISEGRVDILDLYDEDKRPRTYKTDEEWEEIREWEKKPVDPNTQFLDYIPF